MTLFFGRLVTFRQPDGHYPEPKPKGHIFPHSSVRFASTEHWYPVLSVEPSF